MFHRIIGICSTLAVAALLNGCIPEEAPEKPFEVEAPADADGQAAEPATVEEVVSAIPVAKADEENAEVSEMNMSMQTHGSVNAGIQVTPMEGKTGFKLIGTYNLSGTITPTPEDPETWVLEGTFTFPTEGFSVQEPYTTPLDDMALSPTGAELKAGSGSMVIITIPVHAPTRDDVVAQVETEVSVSKTFKAKADAQFTAILGSY